MMKRIALEHFEARFGPLSPGNRLHLELIDALLDSALWFLSVARRASAAGLIDVSERYLEAARGTVDELRKLSDPPSKELLYGRPCWSAVRRLGGTPEIFRDQI